MFETYIDRQERGTTEKYFGKYPGLVLQNTPPENDQGNPNRTHRGELLVEVPGILEETEDGKGEQPIRIWARPCFHPGFFFIPEMGDQVWVEFIAGDINSPVWTGVWYPLKATPKTVAEEAPTRFQKVIRTASGHVVQLDDTEDEEKIVITHKSGAKIEMNKDGSILIANEKNTFIFLNAREGQTTLFDEHQNLLTMTSDGVVVATQGSFIELKGGNMKVVGDEAVQIAANNVILNASKISLGGEAAQMSLLIAEKFAALFDTHVHAHPMGPTLPPTVPLTPSVTGGAVTSLAVKVI